MNETTPPIMTITDELLAELEAAANDCPWADIERFEYAAAGGKAYCLGSGPHEHLLTTFDRRFQRHIELSNPATILGLLQHVRELKADAERMTWLEDNYGGHTGGTGGFHMHMYLHTEAELLRDMIDAARSSAD